MPKKNIAVVLNEMMHKPIVQCLHESGMNEDEKALLVASILDVAKKNVKIQTRTESDKEWAIRMGYKVKALERQVDRLTNQIRSQNEFFLRMAEALDAAITRGHPGRFAERLKLVKPDSGQEAADTVRADEIQKHMNKAEDARQRHDE